MSDAGCPNREELFALLVGTLREDSAEAMIIHVDSCEACRAALETFDEADDTLVARLRQPAAEHACLDEAECHSAIDRAGAVVERSLSTTTRPGAGTTTGLGQGGRLGEYRLLEKLGQGGMGTVYKAEHTKLGRTVALKLLPADRLRSSRAVARFEREMLAIGGLTHPNIVQAHDAREVDDMRFLVMEFVEGLDLHKLVQRSGPLQTADACELIRQAALGLQYAHEHGLVHRDVKPSNLMLTSEGRVKVLDLGLARLQEEQPSGEEMTAAGQAMGTADYMAPEQASDSHSVDIRADVYSLGCTLYSLLAGCPPFSGPKYRHTFEKMTAHARDPVPPIRDICPEAPDELVDLLDRMLAKDPAARPSTPADVADAVGPLCTGSDLPALLPQAEGRPEPAVKEDVSLAATDELASSAQVGTQATHPAVPLPAARRWQPLAVAVGLMLLAAMAYPAWQIVIRIRDKEGRETVVAVPADSQVTVEQDSQVVGQFPVADARRPAPSDPALDREPKAGEPPSLHPVDPDFVKAVAALPTEQQIETVREKLVQLNPGFDGELTYQITGDAVTSLTFKDDHVVTDLSPVRALERLEVFTCSGAYTSKGKLADLLPLRGLPLTALICNCTSVSDLSPLKAMKLTGLNCESTDVWDLSPLEGMPLTWLGCVHTQVSDLTPLKG
ncbi:MAG: protein kinase, partial [Planctomycetes bacterium]|nr:protein kinase [Planctomycetota bacterium]